ncbi:MAG: DinB family protein [Deltaproteobacteria bacterium]
MMQDIPDLLAGLRRTSNILSAFVASIPEASMDLRRGEGFWTIAEHVGHLVQVQSMLLDRLQRFMAEDHPEFIPYLPDSDQPESPLPPRMEMTAAKEQFAAIREKQLALLENADERTWLKTATHPEYEHYSLYILVRHILMHDFWHMYRME